MFKFNLDLLIYSEVGSKKTEGYDRKLYNKLEVEFNSLKNFWSKAYFLFILSRSGKGTDFNKIYNKLLLELNLRESNILNQYINPYIIDMKKLFISGKFQEYTLTELVNSFALFGRKEIVSLLKITNIVFPALASEFLNSKQINLTKEEANSIFEVY